MKQQTEILKTAVPLLLEWFRENKRDLPWRHGRNFYTCLVSEFLLQQTRVEAVKERYTRFLARFPDLSSLASASEDEVLKEWEGLGYYTRARNLLEAAREAKRKLPSTYEEVRALKGVGDYTAGAICSVALGLNTPAVDGNVIRVLTRLFADPSVDDPALRREYSSLLSKVYPPETADFTEGLMELGAIVCLPNGKPLCGDCPWRELCRAHQKREEERYPVKPEKRARRREERTVFVLRCGREYALLRRGKGLLAGLWEFPNALSSEAVLPKDLPVLAQKRAKHVFTHIEWEMTGYLLQASEKDSVYTWATAEEIGKTYALPSAFKAFFEWVK